MEKVLIYKATSNRMLVSCPPPVSTEIGRMVQECYYWVRNSYVHAQYVKYLTLNFDFEY